MLGSSTSLSGAAWVWVSPPPPGCPSIMLALAASFPPSWGVWGLLAPAGGELQPLLRGQAWVMVPCL